jgi:hypothetical protein
LVLKFSAGILAAAFRPRISGPGRSCTICRNKSRRKLEVVSNFAKLYICHLQG